LFTITFTKTMAAVIDLHWDNSAINSEYAKFDNGNYLILTDDPTASFYTDGQLTFLGGAPLVTAGVVSSATTTATVPVTVSNFDDIGSFRLTMTYDGSKATATSAIPNVLLGGTFTYDVSSPGIIVMNWTKTAGVTLTDDAILLNITFSKVEAGIIVLNWDNNATNSQFCKYDGGHYLLMTDEPGPDYYFPGQLTFQGGAPVTQASFNLSASPPATVLVTVSNFRDIGALSLNLNYDAGIALPSNVVPNVLLEGAFTWSTQLPGTLFMSWTRAAGVTLTDDEVLFTITFDKVGPGLTALSWDNNGINCEYAKFDGGNYLTLLDSPTNDYYIPGQLIFLADAPITTAPDLMVCTNGSVEVPITVKNFNDIGIISLSLQYNPAVLEFQSYTSNAGLPANFTLQAAIPGTVIASGYISGTETGVHLADDAVLFTLTFLYHSGSTALTWYDNGTSCEYGNFWLPEFVTAIDVPKASFYVDGSIGELFRPTVVTSGSATINKGESTDITFTLTGAGPWALTYTDGTTPVSQSVSTSPFIVSVHPITNTTYSIVSLSDVNCSAQPINISGTAVITVKEMPLDIILQKSSNCGEFAVKLKPLWAVSNTLTNVIFTIRWAANAGSDVQLTDIVAVWPGLVQQGNRELSGGYYYVSFSSATNYAVNWLANSENLILSFKHSGTGEGTTDFTIIASDYGLTAPGINTAYYAEVGAIDQTSQISNQANAASLNCCFYLKTMLQGAYNTSTHSMSTTLNDNAYLPLTQPYASTPMAYAGTESVAGFSPSVVDWVVLEIRSGSAASSMILRRAALLLSDGSIVGTDQLKPPVFHELSDGTAYYVVVLHRNHLPVMTSSALTFPNTVADRLDLSILPADNVYGGPFGVVMLEPGIFGQISGDINMDNKLIYTGLNNDRGRIIAQLTNLVSPVFLNSTYHGYYAEDLNMNTEIRYTGIGNDQAVIMSNIDYFTEPSYLNSIFTCPVPMTAAKDQAVSNEGPVDLRLQATAEGHQLVLQANTALAPGAFDNIQFCLKWQAGANDNGQSLVYGGEYGLKAQGEPIRQGDWYYQVFVMADWAALPQVFCQGSGIVIMQVQQQAGRELDGLALASQLDEVIENAEYYVSILGKDQTGHIKSLDNSREEGKLLLYPNPAEGGDVYLSLTGATAGMAEITIFDILGKQVSEYSVYLAEGDNNRIGVDISVLSSGYYSIRLNNAGKVFSEKLIRN